MVIEEAKIKAKKLLMSHLDFWQRLSLRIFGEFNVNSQHGHRYAITNESSSNVYALGDGDERVASFCIGHYGLYEPHLPKYDTMLAQKLLLEHNEDWFILTANMKERKPQLPDWLAKAIRDKRKIKEREFEEYRRRMLGHSLQEVMQEMLQRRLNNE